MSVKTKVKKINHRLWYHLKELWRLNCVLIMCPKKLRFQPHIKTYSNFYLDFSMCCYLYHIVWIEKITQDFLCGENKDAGVPVYIEIHKRNKRQGTQALFIFWKYKYRFPYICVLHSLPLGRSDLGDSGLLAPGASKSSQLITSARLACRCTSD